MPPGHTHMQYPGHGGQHPRPALPMRMGGPLPLQHNQLMPPSPASVPRANYPVSGLGQVPPQSGPPAPPGNIAAAQAISQSEITPSDQSVDQITSGMGDEMELDMPEETSEAVEAKDTAVPKPFKPPADSGGSSDVTISSQELVHTSGSQSDLPSEHIVTSSDNNASVVPQESSDVPQESSDVETLGSHDVNTAQLLAVETVPGEDVVVGGDVADGEEDIQLLVDENMSTDESEDQPASLDVQADPSQPTRQLSSDEIDAITHDDNSDSVTLPVNQSPHPG